MSSFHKVLAGLSLLLPLVAACQSETPASPNDPSLAPAATETKFVFPIEDSFTYACSDGTNVTVQIGGWIQGRFFEQANNRNVQLNVFHNTWTFTNTVTGQQFFFHESGPDRLYVEDGKLFIAVTGQIPNEVGIIGHLVYDLSGAAPARVFTAGKVFGDLLLLACDDLT
jgi:hypothetical protein